jgi:hypothetical protein
MAAVEWLHRECRERTEVIFSRRSPMDRLASSLLVQLTPHGFQLDRKAKRFYLMRPQGVVVVELQRSSKSTSATLVVTVNIGIWNSVLAQRFGGPAEADGISAMDCHWWTRAGQLFGGEERWWSVGLSDDAAATAADMWSSFLSSAVSLFVPLAESERLLEYLRVNQPSFLDPMNRWAFVLVLASIEDDRAAVKTAADELAKIGASRTLPIGHRMLLRTLSE